MNIELPSKVRNILDVLDAHGYEAYVVGGCVRDSILQRKPEDWDITTSARPEEVKALFRRTIDTGIAHGTVTVMQGDEGFEVTTYRVDGKYEDGRHPSEVTFTPNLEEDLLRDYKAETTTVELQDDHAIKAAYDEVHALLQKLSIPFTTGK